MADHPISKIVIDKSIKVEENTIYNQIQSSSGNLIQMFKSIQLTKSELSKLEIVKNIHSQIKFLGEGNSLSEINIELCKLLLQQIGQGRSKVEKELLNVVLTITEFGSDIVKCFEENRFFQIFNDSGLLKKIEEILQQKLNDKKKDKQSESILQLAQTISFINKHKELESNICKQYGQILSSHIKQLTRRIIQLSDEYKIIGKQLTGENSNIENEIKIGIRSLKAINNIMENYYNETEIIINFKIYEIIPPLIHLNCNPSLNCPQYITLSENEFIHELLVVVYKILKQLVASFYGNIRDLLDYSQVYQHIVPIIISFAENASNIFKQDFKYHSTSSILKDLSFQSQIVVDGALYILQNLLFYNSPFCKQAESNLILLQTLSKLSKNNRKRVGIMKIDNQFEKIRVLSNNCLCNIFLNASNEIKQMIVNDHQYIQAQIQEVGNRGRNVEQSDRVIISELYNIKYVFDKLNEKTGQINFPKDIRLVVNEEIELEGGIEGIEAHLYRFQMRFNRLAFWAENAKDEMNNIYQDSSNNQL